MRDGTATELVPAETLPGRRSMIPWPNPSSVTVRLVVVAPDPRMRRNLPGGILERDDDRAPAGVDNDQMSVYAHVDQRVSDGA